MSMNKQQALKELTELRARADALEAILNEPESYGRERVQEGRLYWIVDEVSTVCEKRESTLSFGNRHFKMGNYYHTQEEAEKARDKTLAYVRITDAIREQNKGWVPDWGDAEAIGYSFSYDHDVNNIYARSTNCIQREPTEFYGTEEAIGYVIKHHADDIKLYLGVSP